MTCQMITRLSLLPGASCPRAPLPRTACKAATEAAPSTASTPYRLQLTPEEKLSPAPSIVLRAEMAMNDYCATLKPGTTECEECWQAWQYFRGQKVEAQSSCSLEERHGLRGGPGCSSLDRFEDLVRRLYGQVSVENLVKAFFTLRRMADEALRKRGDSPVTDSQDEELQAKHVAGLPADSRHQLIQLFRGMDKNADGRLDVAEFRAAMDQLQTALSGDSVGIILEAMDIHAGQITLDQFLTIAEVEGMVAHSPLNRWLSQSSRRELADMRSRLADN